MNTLQTIENQFWSHVFRRSTSSPKEEARIKQRLAPECAQYVAIKLREMNGQPQSKLYDGTSEQFLAEVEKRYFEIRDEERAKTSTTTSAASPSTGIKVPTGPIVAIFILLALISFLVYWFWIR